MKNSIRLIGLLALSCVAASAASVKTSKPTPLSDTQMAAVKGQGTVTVLYYDYQAGQYRFLSSYDTGPNGPTYTYYNGGPLNGTHT